MYDRRLEISAIVFGKLRKTHRIFKNLVSPRINPEPSEEKSLISELNQAAEDFRNYFQDNQLFIPAEIANKIEQVQSKIQDAMASFQTWLQTRPHSGSTEQFKTAMNLVNECDALFNDIKIEFNKLFDKPNLASKE